MAGQVQDSHMVKRSRYIVHYVDSAPLRTLVWTNVDKPMAIRGRHRYSQITRSEALEIVTKGGTDEDTDEQMREFPLRIQKCKQTNELERPQKLHILVM
jgi:hypothetical protein